MKPESLNALIIDRHFGELSPEAEELLEHHLAAHVDARAEAERIVQSLNVARDAVVRHPELARVPVEVLVVPRIVRMPSKMPWLARAAALVLLAGAGGFFAGRSNVPTAAASAEKTPEPRRESPWAKYRMSFDPAGEGMRVVRVEAEKLEPRSLQ